MFAVKLIIALIVLALLAINVRQSLRVKDGETHLDWARVGGWAAFAIAVIFGLLPSMGQVPSGFRGVVLRFGATTGEVKSEGLYFLPPFVESIALMDVQVHAHKAAATSASKDLQNVAAEITLNYRLDPLKAASIYRDLRNEYESRIIAPSVQEAVKATTARFDAEKLVTERPLVSTGIEEALRSRLASHGILIDQMSITNFQFSKDFADAIEAKVVATQQALKAENDLRRITVEAAQRIATAKGEAEAIRIQAASISAQGGEAYVHLKAIEKWDGKLPTYMTSGAAMPFVSIPKQ